MWELGPFATLGPAGAIQAAGRLPGGWLELAYRLGNPRCQFSERCSRKGEFFSAAKLLRTCKEHKARCAAQRLINEFLYDTKPSYTVHSASDLRRAILDCGFGDCIRLTADIFVDRDLDVSGCRLQGVPPSAGSTRKLSIAIRRSPLLAVDTILEGLDITVGDENWCNPERCFAAVEAEGSCGAVVRRCNITSYQGTALMACSCGIVAEDCVLSSNDCFLGAVVRSADCSFGPGFLSIRGCVVEDNQWGAFLGKDTPADVKRAVLAANTFRHNSIEDITDMYTYTGQRVQPWRRGWDSAKP